MVDLDAFMRRWSLARRTHVFGQALSIKENTISSEEYAAIQASMPIHCVDVFAADPRGHMLLGVRVNKPAKGFLWPTGGRKLRNEIIAQAAARHVKKDTGLVVETSRFAYLDHAQLLFDDRQQEPQNSGADTPVTMTGLLLSAKEAETASATGELGGLRLMTAQEISQERSAQYVLDGFDLLQEYRLQALALGRDRP
jgi:hypothetical protein